MRLDQSGGHALVPAALSITLACAALLGWRAPAAPQPIGGQKGQAEEVPEVDPYTKGDPELMAELGYVSFGPFGWGDDHDTDEILRVLGQIPLRWVETEHFRIGSSLPDYTIEQDKEERAKIRDELKRLKKRGLPRVKPSARELDRWLRLHLYAQRLEELYDDFCQRIGVSDEDFAGQRSAISGEGPYLGQRSKYLVLLCEKASGIGRYCGHFLGQGSKYSMRWSFHRSGSMFFGTSPEPFTGSFGNDTAFHCSVVSGVVHNFIDGFRWYRFESPLWWKNGLAHVFTREVDERYNAFGSGNWSNAATAREEWDWEPRVHGRVKHDYYPSWEKMFAWSDYEELKVPEHMISWSRVQFLLQEPAAAREYMIAIKQDRPPVEDPEEWARVQAEIVTSAWGEGLEELDRGWAKWVLKTYPSR